LNIPYFVLSPAIGQIFGRTLGQVLVVDTPKSLNGAQLTGFQTTGSLMFMLKSALIFAVLAFPAAAQQCAPLPDMSQQKDRLHAELLSSQSEMRGRAIGDQLWQIWTKAPDAIAQELLDKGVERLRVADYERAEAVFSTLIKYCPDYAEGWNQRAYSHFLRQQYDESLDDLAETLAREPRHFGALAGRALVLLNMGRTKLGQNALRKALKVNPWLSERHLLPPGEDI